MCADSGFKQLSGFSLEIKRQVFVGLILSVCFFLIIKKEGLELLSID